jgi:cytosine permease
MWGMKTGLPLYVVGSSTFGVQGGYFLPGIFMGVLQVGWYSVATFYAAKLVIAGLGGTPKTLLGPLGPGETHGFDVLFVVVAIVWGYLFAFFGAKGIKYVARMASIFPVVPILMLLIGAIISLKGLGKFGEVRVANAAVGVPTMAGMLLAIQMVIGFGATALAAGADFTQNNRNASDVKIGGLASIWGASVVVGILALITVAGANGANPKLNNFGYAGSLGDVGGFIAKIMLILFAIGSMAPACFCSFIIGNSLSTMVPSISRMKWTMIGATVGILLGATGIAGNLESFFGLIGASFGPVCGAMAADYLLTGGKWAGPRKGISIPGYAAWALGFLVGISNNALLGKLAVLKSWHPAALYSFVVGFVVYLVLAAIGLQPPKEEAYVVTEPPETA